MFSVNTLASVLPILLGGVSLLLDPVDAHAYVVSPPSRQWRCKCEPDKYPGGDGWQPNTCARASTEPWSVENTKGVPFDRDVGNKICSGGTKDGFEYVNNVTQVWERTPVVAGHPLHLGWEYHMHHNTSHWTYYMTKNEWDPRNLNADSFDPTPLLVVPGKNEVSNGTNHTLPYFPVGREGGHLILAVWEIADTSYSFYSCLDVDVLPGGDCSDGGHGGGGVHSPASDGFDRVLDLVLSALGEALRALRDQANPSQSRSLGWRDQHTNGNEINDRHTDVNGLTGLSPLDYGAMGGRP